MKKLLRIIAILLGLGVLLAGGAAIGVALFFDPNDYKDEITAWVEKHTGRKLDLRGDIKLSVFPWLGVELGALSLGNAPGFGREPFLISERAEVRVRLLPLLKKEVRTDTVSLQGMSVNLTRAKDGRANWDDFLPPSAQDSKHKRLLPPALLALGGIEITNARINWTDHRQGKRYLVAGLDLHTEALLPGQPADLALSFTADAPEYDMRGAVQLKSTLEYRLDARRYQLAPLDLNATLEGPSIPGGRADLKLHAALEGDLNEQTLVLSDLNVQGLGLAMKGAGRVEGLLEHPNYQGTLKLAPFNLREVLAKLGREAPVTADPRVLTRIAADMGLSASGSGLTLTPMTLWLDETQVKGGLTLDNFSKPAVEFKLALDALDADRYLPPKKPGKGPTAATPAAAGVAAAGLPLDTLRAFNIKGGLNIGKLKIAKLRLDDLSLRIHAKEGDIRLSPIAAQLYSGRYSGDIGLDARGSQPRLTLNESLTAIEIEPLLTDLMDRSRLSGVGDVKAHLGAAGADLDDFKKTLAGTVQFALRDGAFKGVNLGLLIRKAQAGYTGPVEAQLQTDFSLLEGTLNFASGRVSNNDLKAKSPVLRVAGEGSADLVTEQIDYTLNTTLVATVKGQGGRELEELKGLTIPIRISGTFSDPHYTPDLAAMAKTRAKHELERRKEEAKAKVEEKIEEKLKGRSGDELKRQLKDLLQRL